MIHYHGTPITPQDAAVRILTARHAFISFAHPEQIDVLSGVCQTIALDNGAFSVWKRGAVPDWPAYYAWSEKWLAHPSCDWAVIPDVIGGDEAANRVLIEEWPHEGRGVPVWHMNESFGQLKWMAERFPRIAFGSCDEYDAQRRPDACASRLHAAFSALGFVDGHGPVKVHGLRLAAKRWQRFPFASVDSTNVARNVGLDASWSGHLRGATKATRGLVLAEHIESPVSEMFDIEPVDQLCLFAEPQL